MKVCIKVGKDHVLNITIWMINIGFLTFNGKRPSEKMPEANVKIIEEQSSFLLIEKFSGTSD